MITKCKKIMSLILVLSFIFVNSSVAYADDNLLDQEPALKAYERICKGLSIDYAYENLPDEVGGFYLNGDYLVIQLTDIGIENQNKYMQYCEGFDKVIFEEVEYSYNYLRGLTDFAINSINRSNVVEYYVDVYSNSLAIGVEELGAKDVRSFDEINSLPITFFETNTAELNAMKGGEGIGHSSSSSGFSICYFGMYAGRRAMITCGHGNEEGDSIYYGNQKVGTIVYQNFKRFIDYNAGKPASYGDYSIIDIQNSPVSSSSYVSGSSGSSILIDSSANVLPGLLVNFSGMITKGLTGTIESTNVTQDKAIDPITYEECIVKGVCKVKSSDSRKVTQPGDSGGCVYITTVAGRKCVVGSINSSNSWDALIYFTPNYHMEDVGFEFD